MEERTQLCFLDSLRRSRIGHEDHLHQCQQRYGEEIQCFILISSRPHGRTSHNVGIFWTCQRHRGQGVGKATGVPGFDGTGIHRIDVEHEDSGQLPAVHGCTSLPRPWLGCL